MTDYDDNRDIEAALRASLAEQARHAPVGGPRLADRIVTEAQRAASASPDVAPPSRFPWKAWTLPLIAAASVAAVVVALSQVGDLHHSAAPSPGDTGSPSISTSAPSSPTATAPQPPPNTISTPPSALGLSDVHLVDLTFVSADEAYGLATADCLTGSGRCTAMVHTTDGGTTWTSMKPPPANVYEPGLSTQCADPCVRGMRFANSQIGYAYGSGQYTVGGGPAFFMTTDGGASWHREAGGADALETLDGNVIRVVDTGGCPPGCAYSIEIAPIGSTAWKAVSLAGQPSGVAVSLSRSGRYAYLSTFGNQASGGIAKGTLYVSTDNGQSWTRRDDPCANVAGVEYDSVAMASAADGSVTLLCQERAGSSPHSYTTTSTDGGQTFQPGSSTALGSAGASAVGAASAKVLFVMSDVLYRSADGGQSWQKVQRNSVGPLAASVIGFESDTVGRVLEPDASDGAVRTVWTTRDAGQTWTSYRFP
jgi:photosystem II stability/assembly factor-like uncharacterized protein